MKTVLKLGALAGIAIFLAIAGNAFAEKGYVGSEMHIPDDLGHGFHSIPATHSI